MIDLNKTYMKLEISDTYVDADTAAEIFKLLVDRSAFTLKYDYHNNTAKNLISFTGEKYPQVSGFPENVKLTPAHTARLLVAKNNDDALL